MLDHPLLTLFIFLLVLFLYLHITAQWKKSEDLEIYEMDYLSNAHLQEICAVKQPVLFEFTHLPELYDRLQLANMAKYETYDVGVKDTRDYYKSKTGEDADSSDSVDAVALPLHSAIRLMESDTNSRYISENNGVFLEETGLGNIVAGMDPYLKPTGNLYSKLDLLLGSKGAATPLQYHTTTNYFIVVTGGKIRVKMTPWKSRKMLYPIKDYDQYEFRSTVNVWTPAQHHKHEMDKLRFLDFEVPAGYILAVPPYWWYSIKYSSDPANCVCAITYDTGINALAHIHEWAMYYLQHSNITKKVSKPRESRESREYVALDSDPATNIPPPPIPPSDPSLPNQPISTPEVAKPPETKEIITNAGIYHVST